MPKQPVPVPIRLADRLLGLRGERLQDEPLRPRRLVPDAAEVRVLVGAAPTVIYSTSKREVSLRVETLSEALELPDAIVQARAA